MTEAEWLASDDAQAMLAWLRERHTYHSHRSYPPGHGKVSDRKLRLFACACCRQVWPLLTDERSRRAVEVAERYADGLATREERESAIDEAWGAAAPESAPGPTGLAHDCLIDDPTGTRELAIVPAAAQAALLRDVMGDPFRPVAVGPAWLTPTVVSLAHAACDERLDNGTLDDDRLGVLADALTDAGCDNDDLLSHLLGVHLRPDYGPGGWRQTGPHVRGCWVLDLLLDGGGG